MNHRVSAALVCGAFAVMATAHAAEPAHESAHAHAAQADPPPAGVSRTLPGYRPYREAEVRDWRESNETVARIGGWKAYAREAQGSGEEERPAHQGVKMHRPMHEGHR